MSDNTTAAPAGASEQALAPKDDGPLSISAAAAMLADAENAPETPAAADGGAVDSANSDTTPSGAAGDTGNGAEPAQTEETAPDEDAAPPAEEVETDAGTGEDQLAHGNMRTRLRDGTVTTVGELKKLADEAKELRAKASQYAEQEQQFRQLQERAAQIAQQEQFVQTILPLALQQMQARIPPKPDPALRESDPFDYWMKKDAHEEGVRELQQMAAALQQQQQQQQQKLEAARAAQVRQMLDANRKALIDRIPEIADPAKAQAIYQEFVDIGAKYDISKQEVETFYDARVLHMVRDLSRKAAAYDKLMAQKPAATKTVAPPKASPVQQPGRRAAPGEAEQQAVNERLRVWRENGGSLAEAAAIYADLS